MVNDAQALLANRIADLRSSREAIDSAFANLDWARLEQELSVLKSKFRQGAPLRESSETILMTLNVLRTQGRKYNLPADRPEVLQAHEHARQQGLTLIQELERREASGAAAQEAPPPLELGIAIAARGLEKRYGRFRLKQVGLEVRHGEVVAIVGANSSGKSTLLRILSGVERAERGELLFSDSKGQPQPWLKVRPQIGYVSQQPQGWRDSVEMHLSLRAAFAGTLGEANKDLVDQEIQRLGLIDVRELRWSELSGGMKMRCALASALVTRPSILILDEPLAPLDWLALQTFLRDLRAFADEPDRRLAIVLSSQHVLDVEAIADRVYMLDDGSILKPSPALDPRRLLAFYLTSAGTALDDFCERFNAAAGAQSDREHTAIQVERKGIQTLLKLPAHVSLATLLDELRANGIHVKGVADITDSSLRLLLEAKRAP
jgi:ABC-type multidrug transport system ATPase subunit